MIALVILMAVLFVLALLFFDILSGLLVHFCLLFVGPENGDQPNSRVRVPSIVEGILVSAS